MSDPAGPHPFLTPRGLRLQQIGRLDQAVPKSMPLYEGPPATPFRSPESTDPFGFDTTSTSEIHNIRGSKKHPSPDVLSSSPLDNLYKVRRLKPGTDDPLRAIGKLFIRLPGSTKGALASGSAWIFGPSTIITAAHNLYDSGKRSWSQSLQFHPAFDYYRDFGPDAPPMQTCRVTAASLPRRYLSNPTTDLDIAICYTDLNIGDVVGQTINWMPVEDVSFYESRPIAITGYPAGSGFDFGKQMWRSVGDLLFSRTSSPTSDSTPVMATSFGAGASGGPWIVPSGDGYAAVGLTSGHAKLRYSAGEHSLESLTSPMITGRLLDELQSNSVFHEFEV